MGKSLAKYKISADWVSGEVEIKRVPEEFVPIYFLKLPEIEAGTKALLEKVRENLIAQIPMKPAEIMDITSLQNLKKKIFELGLEMLRKELPNVSENVRKYLIGLLIHEMVGLGKIEMLLADGELEEIVINNASEPVWVYHKKFGWLKTNVVFKSESEILNYAASIGRRVGRQITVLDPLMDDHLITGDRVNATLFPISTKGNTITIRKFRRKPWTITELIDNNTVSSEVAALLWLAIQYELNMIVSGGTASGKTTFLNALLSFIPPNHRVVSIEDTRELSLPQFLHWIPLTTREPNPEGKGEITMLDLLVNSLRMRPDRIIVGEIRRQREAEVLFEAMHTGHSVYATLHADTAEQTYRRMVNPPINIPESMLESLHLITVCFRDRRRGIRRVYQVAELIPGAREGEGLRTNVLFRWKPSVDKIVKQAESYRLMDELRLHTGMSQREVSKDLEVKRKILEWMVKHKVNTVNAVGRVVAEYYSEPEKVLKIVRKNENPKKIIPKRFLEG